MVSVRSIKMYQRCPVELNMRKIIKSTPVTFGITSSHSLLKKISIKSLPEACRMERTKTGEPVPTIKAGLWIRIDLYPDPAF
jgi:hypothetical protein